jgi:spore germination protein KA
LKRIHFLAHIFSILENNIIKFTLAVIIMNLKTFFNNFFVGFSPSPKDDFSILSDETNFPNAENSSELLKGLCNTSTVPKELSFNISDNLNTIKTIYNSLINSDVVIREFLCTIHKKSYSAFLIHFDGMTNSQMINDFLLKPLMRDSISSNFKENNSLHEYVLNTLMPQNNVKKLYKFSDVCNSINSGNCVLFIDTINVAFDIDIKKFEQRSVNTPENEIVIKGPQEAFIENIRTNTSLLRRIVHNENMIIENFSVGSMSQTSCSICYIKGITNSDLISEVKYRLNNLDIESLQSSGQLEQLLEERGSFGIPQILSTERPDKCAKFLYEGRVIVLVNGNPYALIMPAVAMDFLTSPEDTNIKSTFANFLRFLRFLAVAITLFLPGIYVALTSFHQEILPTELLFSIISSRENVPFPVIVELLIMEISFELIREAGIRVPSPIGSTIGIVGGIIIGEAAVSANIVSPFLVIIVAITGIASFAIPDFSFGFHLRVFRFVFIFLGFAFGFLGIGIGIFAYVTILCSIKSFGVPFTSPFTPMSLNQNTGYVVPPTWKHESRQTFVGPENIKRQNKISKKWEY